MIEVEHNEATASGSDGNSAAASILVWASAELTFTTIDVPGVGYTSVQGMNTVADLVEYYVS